MYVINQILDSNDAFNQSQGVYMSFEKNNVKKID